MSKKRKTTVQVPEAVAHSKEPFTVHWHIGTQSAYVLDARGATVAWCSPCVFSSTNNLTNSIDTIVSQVVVGTPEAIANAKRIAACVNACAGVEDPEPGELARLRDQCLTCPKAEVNRE